MTHRGTISRIVQLRGFGFIRLTGENRDVFFHCSQLSPALIFNEQLEERRVSFDIEETQKGPQAIDVRPAD